MVGGDSFKALLKTQSHKELLKSNLFEGVENLAQKLSLKINNFFKVTEKGF